MCGVAGVWLPGRADDAVRATEAMGGVLAHRGPDASGLWSDENAGLALGHRRLAVVGLGPSGAQPMVSASQRWVLTYNGEIYNAPALSDRLAAEGVRFRGSSDTEVLVEALDRWGLERTLDALDGMFAFGAWDAEQRRLVLARDRMGEKPLVYAPVGGGWAFASELGALRIVPGFDDALDLEALTLYLRHKCIPAPWTVHVGARKLLPGHWLELRAGSTVPEPVAYWSMAAVVEAAADDQLPDDPETIAELDRVLSGAVAATLRSEVPLGSFLSGGIDSALVSALAAENLAVPLRTFTIASPDRDHDESDHARAVAAHLGCDHTELTVTASDAIDLVPSLASSWDEPFADSSQLPTLLLAGLTRDSVTVALSGDGGDELFGGYNRHHWLPHAWAQARRVPRVARRAGGRVLAAPSPATWDRVARAVPERRRPRMVGLKAQKMADVLLAEDEAAAYARVVSHWQEPAAIVPGSVEPPTIALDPARWPHAGSITEQFMAVDAVTYLPDDVLTKVDRATMAVALEARVPLLSRSVVELSVRLPLELKVRDGVGKWALREVLAQRVPRPLWERPKSGFGVPIAAWLQGPLRPWAESLLSERSLEQLEVLDPRPIRAAWAEHLAGRRDRSYELWDILMLVSWLQGRSGG